MKFAEYIHALKGIKPFEFNNHMTFPSATLKTFHFLIDFLEDSKNLEKNLALSISTGDWNKTPTCLIMIFKMLSKFNILPIMNVRQKKIPASYYFCLFSFGKGEIHTKYE